MSLKDIFAKALLIIMINLLLTKIDLSYAELSTQQSRNPFGFIGVGEEDNIKTAIEKNTNKGNQCTIGKSSSIEINSLNIKNQKLLVKIEEIIKIDKDLLQWSSSHEIEEMPIDVLHCVSKTDNTFNYWDYFFSNQTDDLLSVLIYSKKNKSVQEQLVLKHGQCIENDLCKNNDNFLFITGDSNKHMFIIFLYTKNIKLHHEIMETEQLNKKKMEEKHLKEAF